MVEQNPFAKAYDALWALAEESALLTSLVRAGNRVKFNHTRPFHPVKQEVSEADLPELALASATSSANLHNTSSSSMIVRQYTWLLSTGDMSITNKLMPVEWALFAAMTNWKLVLGALTWNGEHFVKRANVVSIDNGFADPERNRGITGWSAAWTCEVEMHFATADLQAVGDAGTGSGT